MLFKNLLEQAERILSRLFFIIIIKPISCVILVISFGNFEVLLEYGCLSGTRGGGKKKDVEKKV